MAATACCDKAKGSGGSSPLRILRRGGAIPAAGGARPQCGCDQADAVPHEAESRSSRLGRGRRGRKSVTALVELKARFDEEANIRWRAILTRRRPGRLWLHRVEDPRQAVIGGAPRRRVACDLRSCRHRQLSPRYPRAFTPICRSLRDPVIARDVARIFNHITGYAEPGELEKMAISPVSLRKRILDHIAQEAANARPANLLQSG